jgi:excisionase family DNA binding protein
MDGKFESPSELLTVAEAASMLRIQISTIRSWVFKRRDPCVKLGGKRGFFRRAGLEALKKVSVVPAKPPETTGKVSEM